MELSSTISLTEADRTKNHHLNSLYQIESSVNIPLSHYNKIAAVYYSITYKTYESNGTTTDHLMSMLEQKTFFSNDRNEEFCI